jgi:hypothetical protein
MTGVADWIIGDDVENQILGAGIADLMRFTELKDERVAGSIGVVPSMCRTIPWPETTW